MIRCFIGCAPDGADAESQVVLEHSLRSRSSAQIEITWMIASRDPSSPFAGWDMSRFATPFSGFRWCVPELCGFKGRALYMDSDLIVLGDIAELWETELAGGQIVAARDPGKFCVSLWDCRRAQGHMLPLPQLRRADGHDRMSAYFRNHPGLVHCFGPRWNYLDSEDRGPIEDAAIVHYTDLKFQPSSRYAIPRLRAEGKEHWYDGTIGTHPRPEIVKLFDQEFEKAKICGHTPDKYIPAEAYGPFGKRSLKKYSGGLRAR